MRVKSIAECFKGSILQYFQPSLSHHKIFVLSIFEWQFYTGFTVIVWLFFVTGIVETEKEDHQHSTGTDPLEREATVCTG